MKLTIWDSDGTIRNAFREGASRCVDESSLIRHYLRDEPHTILHAGRLVRFVDIIVQFYQCMMLCKQVANHALPLMWQKNPQILAYDMETKGVDSTNCGIAIVFEGR